MSKPKDKIFNKLFFLLWVSFVVYSLMSANPYVWTDYIKTFLFSFVALGCLYLSINQSIKSNQAPEYSEKPERFSRLNAKLLAAVMVCFVITNVIIGIRFLVSFSPQGYDTPYYVYNLRSVYFGKIGSETIVHPLVMLLLSPLAYIFQGDPINMGIAMPFFIGSFFVGTIFVSSYILRKSAIYALMASIFSVSNFFFVRLTYDLYSQTIFMSLFYVLLILFLKFLTQDSSESPTKNKYIILMGILFVLMPLIDPTFSALVYLFFAFLFLSRRLPYRKFKIQNALRKKLAITIGVSMAAIFCYMFISGISQNLASLYLRVLEKSCQFLDHN